MEWKANILWRRDGAIFNRFTIPVEVTAKEFSNGVVQSETRLAYWGQSGTLFDSIDENTTALVKQYLLRQTVDQADWLIGTGLFASGIKARALSFLSEPGSAYDDSIRGGKDRQVGHMRHYVKTSEDNSGIHINCGIPNRAFYLIAMEIGGYAWEKAGRIWYESIRDKRLRSKPEFRDFAKITLANARKLYRDGSREVQVVRKEWTEVGIILRK